MLDMLMAKNSMQSPSLSSQSSFLASSRASMLPPNGGYATHPSALSALSALVGRGGRNTELQLREAMLREAAELSRHRQHPTNQQSLLMELLLAQQQMNHHQHQR